MFIKPEIELTSDGSPTLRHPVYGDTYHSVNGAEIESRHVFINNGFLRCDKESLRILEAGFGSGLNALLTLKEAAEKGIKVIYTAVELYPVDISVAEQLQYWEDPDFRLLHSCEWGKKVEINGNFAIIKLRGDLAVMKFDTIFDLVYYDAFAPDTQPELWTAGLFGRIFETMSAGGSLTTYSAKGDVKRALRQAGFEVSRLPGAPGKRHMLRAVKP